MKTKRINLTMTRADAATLHVALNEFLDIGTGEGADESLLRDEDMQTIRDLNERLYRLLQPARRSNARRGDMTQAEYIKHLMEVR